MAVDAATTASRTTAGIGIVRPFGYAERAEGRCKHATRNALQGFRLDRVRSVHGLSHGDIGGRMQLERQAMKSARPVILARRARLHISPKASTGHLQIFCNAEAPYWATVAAPRENPVRFV